MDVTSDATSQPLTREDVERRVSDVYFWWHSIELPCGVVTPGGKGPEVHASELASIQLPDLTGRSVLDIGAWDGFYSFECERRGAERVVALDHYVWSIDRQAMDLYFEDCRRKGIVPPPAHEVPQLWLPEALPGKRGFDLARELRGSRVEARVADFMSTDLDQVGQFDVVLFLGVLYHMPNPLEALTRLARLTGDVAIIETEAIAVPELEHCPLVKFNEVPAEYWWAYSDAALHGMCRAAGFREVRSLVKPPVPSGKDPVHYRAVLHVSK